MLSAKSVDFKSDLWALGVVAYHCLTGGVPFAGETLGSLCVAIAAALFKPPSHYRPELPPAVDSWFARALAVEPEDRFDSAKEMANSFVLAIGGQTSPTTSFPGLSTADWSGGHQPVDPATLNTALQASPLLAEQGAAAAATGHGLVDPTSPTPTFTGTSVASAPPSRSRRVAVLTVGLVAVAISAGAFVALRSDDPSPASAASASTSNPLVAGEPSASSPGLESTTIAASRSAAPTTTTVVASASSNSASLATTTSAPRLGLRTKPATTSTATITKTKTTKTTTANATTTPTTKDRGF